MLFSLGNNFDSLGTISNLFCPFSKNVFVYLNYKYYGVFFND